MQIDIDMLIHHWIKILTGFVGRLVKCLRKSEMTHLCVIVGLKVCSEKGSNTVNTLCLIGTGFNVLASLNVANVFIVYVLWFFGGLNRYVHISIVSYIIIMHILTCLSNISSNNVILNRTRKYNERANNYI